MTIETLKELIQKEAERYDDVLDFKEAVFGLIDLFQKDNKFNSTISGEDLLRTFGDIKKMEEEKRTKPEFPKDRVENITKNPKTF